MSDSHEDVRVEWCGGRAEGWTRRWWRGEVVPLGALADAALLPAELAFRAAARLRPVLYRSGVLARCEPALPVVSIGNLRLGGSGKTPLVRWVVERLLEQGRRPAVVHGGYAEDEPALLRRWLPGVPVLALRDRCAAVERARRAGADAAVLDDAFQHLRIPRRLDIALIPAESWTTRPRLLPRGGWREPPRALRRAHVVLVTRRGATEERARGVAAELAALAPHALVARFRLEPGPWRRWSGQEASPGAGTPGGSALPGSGDGEATAGAGPDGPALLVAAIADPEPFLAHARAAGADVREALLFPDHHPYDAADVERIRARARGRAIVATEKDAVKLAGRLDGPGLWVLPLRAVPESGGEALVERLREAVR